MGTDQRATATDEVGIREKVSFLSDPRAYPHPSRIVCRETHMSWVFIGDKFVYKLKKPVRFPFLDFSTVEQREASCRAEVRLNRRLAPNVYVDVVPLTLSKDGLGLGNGGRPVDWLVVMRRLDERRMLENFIREGSLSCSQLNRLAAVLACFYARARPSLMNAEVFLADWQRKILANQRVLSDPRLAVDYAVRTRIDRALRRFVNECSDLLIDRIRSRRIIDGHGDLRPEHIWLGEPLAIIDCLEFSQALRTVDPFDELAFLAIECERLGADFPGDYLTEKVGYFLRDRISPQLQAFYRCYRATTRARLAFAHLLEPDPRSPEKWPAQGRAYLDVAMREALAVERHLSRRRRSNHSRHVRADPDS